MLRTTDRLLWTQKLPHIIIINIKDWTVWSVPSPTSQLLSPTFLRSSTHKVWILKNSAKMSKGFLGCELVLSKKVYWQTWCLAFVTSISNRNTSVSSSCFRKLVTMYKECKSDIPYSGGHIPYSNVCHLQGKYETKLDVLIETDWNAKEVWK